MAHYDIEITVDPRGNFTYKPAALRVEDGDTVSWVCPDGAFAITLKDRTPFDGFVAQGKKISAMDAFGAKGQRSIPLTVAAGAKGAFHYAVAVAAFDRVFLDAGCPLFIAN